MCRQLVWLLLLTCSCSPELHSAVIYSSSHAVMMHWGQGWRAATLEAFLTHVFCGNGNCGRWWWTGLFVHSHTHTHTQPVPVGVRETCAELFGACICMRPDSCDCADLCFGHLLWWSRVFLCEHPECLWSRENWPHALPPCFSGCAQCHLQAVRANATERSAPSWLFSSDCGSGRFIEFDDPLRLKWRSGSLRAEEILHRQRGNHGEITLPADFILRLQMYELRRWGALEIGNIHRWSCGGG